MNRFHLTIEASALFSSDDPMLEILVNGVVESTVMISSQTGSGFDSYSFSYDYPSASSFPASLSFRFNDGQAEGGRSVTLESVRVNGQEAVSYITQPFINYGTTEGLNTSSADHLFGRVDPTPGDLPAPDQTGTGGDDILTGTNVAENTIDGGAGNDRLRGLDGDDSLIGGGGADKLYGEGGNDIILGGDGADRIYGNDGDDLLHGQGETDRIHGGNGNDLINGGAARDILFGDAGEDIIFGEDGDDRLVGGTGNDTLFGDDGADTLAGQNGDDTLYGGLMGDTLIGGNGADTLYGEGGDDFILGGAGIDTVDGGSGSDQIYGDGDDDILNGGADADQIFGDAGADTLNGDGGADTLVGGIGADIVNGGADDDVLHGHGLDAFEVSAILRANAGVVYSAESNSFYQYVNTGTTWDAADLAAKSVNLNGVTGHLATITTQAENDYIQSLMDGGSSVWLSGSDGGTGTSWSWNSGVETGVQFSSGSTAVNNMYENWLGGEPNSTNTYARIQESDGTWTDRAGTDSFHYVIEWEAGLMADDNAIDTLNGDDNADDLYGYGGDDILNGGAGDDIAFGGSGDDIINGDGGADVLYGDSAEMEIVAEAGRVAVSQTDSTEWHTVNFSATIESAVIKMFAEDVASDPFTIRVRDITDSGFEFQLDEYDYQDGSTGIENISWLAVASGTHTLQNGAQIQAGFVTATNETATNVSFNSAFSNAVVFSQVSSDNELSAVATRNDNVSASGFDVTMQEQESSPTGHATEDIGWIAIESGGSVASGVLVGTTGDVVTHGTTTVNYGGTFATTPIFLADMQTLDGGDVATTVGVSVSTTQSQLFIDEETSSDTETSHTTENVGYVVLEAGTYVAPSVISGSDILRGGDGDDIIYADAFEDTDVAPASASNPLAGIILDDAPEGYWALSETAGTTADNQGIVGGPLDGTINGSPSLGAAALYTGGGFAIDFDGTNDGVRLPDSTFINTSTYAARSVELVFNADDVSTRQVLFEEGGATNGLTIYLDGSNVYVTGEDDGNWVDANLNASVMTGITYHVAFVFDQADNSFTGYLDGVSMGSVTVGNQVFPGHSGDVGIGYAPDGVQFHDGESGSGGFYFDGRISDVALYNTALSAAQIQERSDVVQGIYPGADPIDDTIYGGDGFDQLYAGEGRDVFVFENIAEFGDGDEINGFDVGEQDAIDISDLLTGFVDGVSDINDFVTLTPSGSDSIIAVDTNGSVGAPNFQDLVQLNNFSGTDISTLYINNSIIAV